jgi:hypothetical protein
MQRVFFNCRRMPGYPRIDRGNPYLTARYDHGIVDSLPWGRGWSAEGRVRVYKGSLHWTQAQSIVGSTCAGQAFT